MRKKRNLRRVYWCNVKGDDYNGCRAMLGRDDIGEGGVCLLLVKGNSGSFKKG